MEQLIYSIVYSNWYLWVLGLFICVILLLLRRSNDRQGNGSANKPKLPPGSAGLPFIGETIRFLRDAKSPGRRKFFDEHELRYGPIFRCSLFGRTRAVVSVDPEFNKYVLQNEGRLFESNALAPFRNLIGKYGLSAVQGELQRKLHATAVNLLKHETLSSDFMEDIQDIFQAGMRKWEEEGDIPIQHKCNQIVLNLMAKKLLDLPPSEEMGDIYKAFDDFVGAVLSFPLNIPGTTYARGIRARGILLKRIHKCIKERREHPEVLRNDLLTKLVREGTFSDEIIADTIIFFVFAGVETSAMAMTFAVKYLAENPRALEELRAEHDALLKAKGKGNEKLTWNDYQSMKFVHCVINETLRLGGATVVLFREAKQDIKVKDFVIPKGWTVSVFLSATHVDGKYHYEADKFLPWRWQNEGQETLEEPCYMPFGRGGRLCPGLHLARFEIALFLHNFVTKFRWEQLEIDRATYFPLPSTENGFPIRLYSRVHE
uniref:CYP720B26 n=1 Tax=Taxus chinensis TaxID=29808 RepID=A0A291FAZ1_TAXCH|nr:CYP720B26 [Taxus chinensis]